MKPRLDRLFGLIFALTINLILWAVLIAVAKRTMDLFK
jgi:hypothetical protein